jgi:hypothetical protein
VTAGVSDTWVAFYPLRDYLFMLISLNNHSLHTDPRGPNILVINRFLRLVEGTCFSSNDPRVGAPNLVQLQILNTCARPVFIQVIGKCSEDEHWIFERDHSSSTAAHP